MAYSLESLEYNNLKKLLTRYVVSEGGRELLQALEPIRNSRALDAQHSLNSEAMAYLRKHTISFGDVPSLGAVLAKLEMLDMTLEVVEIESIQHFLVATESFRTKWNSDFKEFPLLSRKAKEVPDLSELVDFLRKAVNGGQVNEGYSSKLKRLRIESENTRSRLNEKLDQIIKSPGFSEQLQEQLVTIRNGRYVVPVRSEQRQKFEGIVHGSSSSGATVFIEPFETLALNNDLVRLEEDQQHEINKILRELTARIQTHVQSIHYARALWSEMDLVFGRARFGLDFDCVSPSFSEGKLVLERARHPLLEENLRPGGEPTPLSLRILHESRVLVISGPNAGGKTVLLKTLGLLSLMAQSGMPVPASKAILPVMDHILADIGDQQSLVDQLSTFSAHVLAVKTMVELASPRSLILIDEIGSSTEPSEGAAFALAVLEHFRSVGSLTVASTHYNRLKVYAETRKGVRNAGMEFDKETLEPTYRLIDGLAGSSSSLDIAHRLKFPAELLTSARQYLEKPELETAHYVELLRAKIDNLDRETLEIERERDTLQTRQKEVISRVEEDYRSQLDRMEKQLDGIVAQIRQEAAAELTKLRRESVKSFERKLEHNQARATDAISIEKRRSEDASKPRRETDCSRAPKPGDPANVISLGVKGSVSKVVNEQIEVTLGSMKIWCPISDIELVEEDTNSLKSNIQFDFSGKELLSIELNLIGFTRDEAVPRLDKFLDDAFLAGASTVRIVHGTGLGVLRKAITDFLESHPHVFGFDKAPANQGGSGVTLVDLKP